MMVYKFCLPVFAKTAEPRSRFLVAEIDGEVEIHGTRDGWSYGETRLHELGTDSMVPVYPADRGFGEQAWRHVRTPKARTTIDIEWRAHINSHGEDGLLDAAERQFSYDYEER